MDENVPYLMSVQPLEVYFQQFQKLPFIANEFSIGRGRSNSVIIPYLSISREHCVIKKYHDVWTIEDKSSFGISINGISLGKGNIRTLAHGDVIMLEPTEAFIYKYYDDDCIIPPSAKRIKLDSDANKDFLNDMKIKFEESQNSEMRHIAEKIYNTQQRQNATMQLKEQLKIDYQKKLEQIECDFDVQKYNLTGEDHEIEMKKYALEEERRIQLTIVKEEMEAKLVELVNRYSQQSYSVAELEIENKILKERLIKEREEFLLELSKENTSKQELLQKLEEKIKEQEKTRLKEKEEFEQQLRIETEQLKSIKENELKELAEQKIRREEELLQELSYFKQNLEGQVEQMELQRCQAEEQLIVQMSEMKKINEKDKEKMKQLILERQTIEVKLYETQQKSEAELKQLKARVSEREVELAAMAAERIQKQAELSNEVIFSLQAQLERVRKQLESVENEKKALLANCSNTNISGESSSNQNALDEVCELMENELQCSVCSELFVGPVTLNCSHTFCIHCITVWKRKKKDCPICRTPIKSECKSLVLESFIEKVLQNLSEDTRKKRVDLLKSRAEMAKKAPVKKTTVGSRSTARRISRHTQSSATAPTVDLADVTAVLQTNGARVPSESMYSLVDAMIWGFDNMADLDGAAQEYRPQRGRNPVPTLYDAPSTSRRSIIEIITDD